MNVESLAIPSLLKLTPRRFLDRRGYFVETFNCLSFARATGLGLTFVQDNQSFSALAGTIRGLHFQKPPFAQDKLVSVLRGAVLDVAVDLRVGSPHYGRHAAVRLDAEAGEMLLIPAGFAHGFCTLEADTLVAYKVSNFYAPDHDAGLIWNDPQLAIEWPVAPESACLSDKDNRLPGFAEFQSPFQYPP